MLRISLSREDTEAMFALREPCELEKDLESIDRDVCLAYQSQLCRAEQQNSVILSSQQGIHP